MASLQFYFILPFLCFIFVFIFITFFYYRNGYIPGEGIAPLPIENTSVIDMSVSEGSLIDILLDELMKVEKAEYDGQARSIEHDIINHQHYLIMEHVSVMVECQWSDQVTTYKVEVWDFHPYG